MKPGLADCPNAVIVPHIASASMWTRSGMASRYWDDMTPCCGTVSSGGWVSMCLMCTRLFKQTCWTEVMDDTIARPGYWRPAHAHFQNVGFKLIRAAFA
eukprot:1160220-Pelagomonas_calceolata.AAC.3